MGAVDADVGDSLLVQTFPEVLSEFQHSSESITYTSFHTCNDDYEHSDTDSLGVDDLSISSQLCEWYSDLQKFCHHKSEKMRVFLSFIETKNHIGGNLTDKSKLAQVRTAFTNFLVEKSNGITTDEILLFLLSNAYFYVQLPWDTAMITYTKGDGLCLYRSLYQLLNLHNMDTKERSQLRKIITADVNLKDRMPREQFVSFLERILEGLQKLSPDIHDHHGGDFCDARNYGEGSIVEKFIKKLTSILIVLNNKETDWSTGKFILAHSLWGDFELVKLIPYLFTTAADGIHEFSGSYYAANSSSRSKIFGEADENDSFAYLTSSMEHRTNIFSRIEPISLKWKYVSEVLQKPKMVFHRDHFFPIVSEPSKVYEELLNDIILDISSKISQFISNYPIPIKVIQMKPEKTTKSMNAILDENNDLKDQIKRMRGLIKSKKDSSILENELRDAKAKAAEMEKKNADLERQLKSLRDMHS